jgi:CubicO group peptidase (beta-lactamase class C family)
VARPWALARCAHPAGGLTTSVRDLLRYAHFGLGDGATADGRRLLAPATLAAMHAPRVPTNTIGGAVGLAWMLNPIEGVRLVQHGGTTNGQTTRLVLAPARDLALIVLTNAGRGSALAAEITRLVLDRLLGVRQASPTARPRPVDQLAAYVGRYTQRLTDIELTLVGDELVMTAIPKGGFPKPDSPPFPAPPPARLGFHDDDRALLLDTYQQGTRVEFLRDAAGAITWLRSGVRLHARQP